jgi:hypothetical protein
MRMEAESDAESEAHKRVLTGSLLCLTIRPQVPTRPMTMAIEARLSQRD